MTRPTAQLLSVTSTLGDQASALVIKWVASDKNLGETPIDLYYATQRGGAWKPIARGLRNDGAYGWVLPRDTGPEFYIRLDATDQAGNLTHCELPQPIVVDLVRPKAKIMKITARTSQMTAPIGN
jgi:hypothetical protein